MFRFTEGFSKTWIPVGPKARDIYKPRLHVRINPKGNVTVAMAVKRKGESWRKVIGKFPNNKLDKQQRDILNEKYRKWFLVLEDETVLPQTLINRQVREYERLHEEAADAQLERDQGAGTVGQLIEDYLDRHVSTLKTGDQIERMFARGDDDWEGVNGEPSKPWMDHLVGGGQLRQLHHIHIADFGRQHLVDVLRDIQAPVMANRARAQMMKLCSFGVEHGWLETNPAINLPKNKEQKCNVILRDEHISAIWPLLQPALKFALATGQRRSEVANMRWSDIRGDVWIQEDTKNGQAHALKLPLFTLNLLPSCREGDYVWPGRDRPKINESTLSHQWLQASKEIGFESKLHDARRTAGSNIAALTGSAEAADRVLNHALPGITSRYVLHDFGDIKAKSLQLWANKLEGLTWVEPTKTRMVALKKKRLNQSIKCVSLQMVISNPYKKPIKV